VLSDAMTKAVCDAIRMGCSDRLACESAGISVTTLHDYIARADSGEQRFADFAAQVRAAKSKIAQAMVSVRTKAALGGDWRAAQAWLGAHRIDECARERLELSGPEGGPVQVDLRTKIAEVLAERSDKDAGVPDDL
jgi:hypothetical protein